MNDDHDNPITGMLDKLMTDPRPSLSEGRRLYEARNDGSIENGRWRAWRNDATPALLDLAEAAMVLESDEGPCDEGDLAVEYYRRESNEQLSRYQSAVARFRP